MTLKPIKILLNIRKSAILEIQYSTEITVFNFQAINYLSGNGNRLPEIIPRDLIGNHFL